MDIYYCSEQKVDFFRKNSKINFKEEDIREFLYQNKLISLRKMNKKTDRKNE